MLMERWPKMSLHLEFTPHSWYMGWAIKKELEPNSDTPRTIWRAYIADGNTYRIDEEAAYTLELLKERIRAYHLRKHNGYGERIAKKRLEQIRHELRAERISYGELAELQSMAEYIENDDVELLEAAGVKR